MAIFDIFSKRQKKLKGEIPDVFTYDQLPHSLRVQIVHIWNDALGTESDCRDPNSGPRRAYQIIVEALRREYGCFSLVESSPYEAVSYRDELTKHFLNQKNPEKALDSVSCLFDLSICLRGNSRIAVVGMLPK